MSAYLMDCLQLWISHHVQPQKEDSLQYMNMAKFYIHISSALPQMYFDFRMDSTIKFTKNIALDF